MATRPGGILTVLMTYLYEGNKREFPTANLLSIPSMAINSFTKVKDTNKTTKPKLMKYVAQATGTDGYNHDEASAFRIGFNSQQNTQE